MSEATTTRQFASRLPRWLRRILIGVLSIIAALLLLILAAWLYLNPSVERTDGIEYGRRDGKPLTMDILQPKRPNGIGVAFIVSGGWKSEQPGFAPVWMLAPILRRGYTVFAISHISQPEASVPQIIDDVHRGIRFVRHHAEQYGIDPQQIGVSGGSAGGHLSLMLATRGGIGSAESTDPIDQESSQVQAVAIFYPPTDLLNMGESTENPGDGGPPKSYRNSFGPDAATDIGAWKTIGTDCSPLYHLSETLPPTLIYHGDADTLVPLDQSERFQMKAAEFGHDVKLVVHPEGGHGWPTMLLDLFEFADWFDEHLRHE